MELWLVLLALYAWECLCFLPPGGASFESRRGGAKCARRSGLYFAHPWPLRFAFGLDGTPLEATASHAIGAGALSFFAATGGATREERALAWSSEVSADGPVVRMAGAPLVRAGCDASAERIAAVLREIARVESGSRGVAAARQVAAALSSPDIAPRVARVRGATLPHRLLATLAALALLPGIPVAAVAGEIAWSSVWENTWPAWLALHGLGWLALALAELRVRAPGRGARLLRAALYPPTQWRASSELAAAALGDIHPLACVAAIGSREDAVQWARSALAECDFPGAPGASDAERSVSRAQRRAAIAEFLTRAGLAEAAAAPPARRSANAGSYCPRCFDEFVASGWVCTGCGVETRGFS